MAYVERTDEEIIAAYEEALRRHGTLESIFLEMGNKRWSHKEALAALKKKDRTKEEKMLAELVLDYYRSKARAAGLDPLQILSE